MKTPNAKPPHLIEEERRERTKLINDINQMTDRIPKKVLNGTDQIGAARFKEKAFNARKIANSAKPPLAKLRAAYLSIEGYYRE